MKRFPFAVAATVMAFTATVGAQGPKAGTTGATKAHAPSTECGHERTKGQRPGAEGFECGGIDEVHDPPDRARRTRRPTRRTATGKSAKTTSTSTSTSDSTGTSTSTGTTAAADGRAAESVSMKIEKNPAQLARAMDFLDAARPDARGRHRRIPQPGSVHRGDERLEEPRHLVRGPSAGDDGRWSQPRSGGEESAEHATGA